MYPEDGIELTDFSNSLPPSLEDYPFEIFLLITRRLSLQDIAALALTNRALYARVNSQDLWADRVKAQFPLSFISCDYEPDFDYKRYYTDEYRFMYS